MLPGTPLGLAPTDPESMAALNLANQIQQIRNQTAAAQPAQPNPVMAAVMQNRLRQAALAQQMARLSASGLPNYFGAAAGAAPSPYQFNMPQGEPQNGEAKARGKVSRRNRRASRMGDWGQRFVDAAPQDAATEAPRGNPALTPAQFLAAKGQEMARAQQDYKAALANSLASGAPFPTGAKSPNVDVAAVNPTQAQANTTARVRGAPSQEQVAANKAARQAELASRKEAVANRGKARGTAREYGVTRMAGAAINGTLGKGGDDFGQLFTHYLALTNNPQMAAALAAQHKNSNGDPMAQQFIAGLAGANTPEGVKAIQDMMRQHAAANGRQAAADVPSVVSNLDQGQVKAAVEKAVSQFQRSPRYAADWLAKELNIPTSEADTLIKNSNHPLAGRYSRERANLGDQIPGMTQELLQKGAGMSPDPFADWMFRQMAPYFIPGLGQLQQGLGP